MPASAQIRAQIEAALAQRIPSALTPQPRAIRPTAATGITAVDELLGGGLPIGAISEIVGPECSGRTTLALAFLASITRQGKVCAWIDVSDALHPESAAAAGIDLDRLLWVRCGKPVTSTNEITSQHAERNPNSANNPAPLWRKQPTPPQRKQRIAHSNPRSTQCQSKIQTRPNRRHTRSTKSPTHHNITRYRSWQRTGSNRPPSGPSRIIRPRATRGL